MDSQVKEKLVPSTGHQSKFDGMGIFGESGVIGFDGVYKAQLIRKGKVIDEFECENMVVDQGLNYVLNAAFGLTAPLASWYVGLFEGNFTPTSGTTASTVAGLSTECTAYTSGTRPAWTTPSATAKQLTNGSSRASFTFNATKTIYGAFLVSSSSKSGISGTLFSVARFTTAKTVDSGDELLVTYVLTAADA